MLKKFTKRMSKGISIALLGMVVLTYLFLGGAAGQPDPVAAAPVDETTVANTEAGPPTRTGVKPVAALATAQCTPVNVGVFDGRVHVKCAAGSIQYFAKSTADANQAARVLSVLSIAQAMGRTLDILYDPADTSGTAIGCQANDCRLIIAVFLY